MSEPLPGPLPEPLLGPVLIVGAGLLGTSVGLALSSQGHEVWLRDHSAENLRTASGLGAGIPDPGGEPALVVIAVPPAAVAAAVAAA
ncbi:MAG: 2-dehydropantoate 2-reductase N-terminal domain-containing protein, partial [Nocardioides sp.]